MRLQNTNWNQWVIGDQSFLRDNDFCLTLASFLLIKIQKKRCIVYNKVARGYLIGSLKQLKVSKLLPVFCVTQMWPNKYGYLSNTASSFHCKIKQWLQIRNVRLVMPFFIFCVVLSDCNFQMHQKSTVVRFWQLLGLKWQKNLILCKVWFLHGSKSHLNVHWQIGPRWQLLGPDDGTQIIDH